MSAFIDGTCAKCGKRYGWTGKVADMPPCPKCGYRPPQDELVNDDAEMEEFENLLLERKKKREAGNA